MTNLVAGNLAVDLTSWAFSPGWHGVSHSATQFVIAQTGTTKVDTFTGTGFGGYDSFGFPTVGTITGIVFAENSQTLVTLSSFSMSVPDERAFASAQNMAGFQGALFAGDDSFSDSPQGDHFFGLGGNDTFNMTHGGADIAQGDSGNDLFNFGGTLTAADTIDGGLDHDTLSLDGDYSGGVTFNASTMTNVETVNVAAGHDYSLTLDDGNVASGQTLTVSAVGLDSENSLHFDGSAETDGRFDATGGAGDDVLAGGAGNDVLRAGVDGIDTLAGNGGDDVLIADVTLGQVSMSGGSGDDTFVIDGGEGFAGAAAGGAPSADIHIQDDSGHDTIDMRGAASGAVIDMATGGQVAGRTVQIGDGGAQAQAGALALDHNLVDGLGGSAGFGENVLPANDDGSTGAIDITSLFGAAGLDFFGTDYTSLFVNNNGNITFAAPTNQFTPTVIDAGAGNPIIAAFWADVDTRGPVGTVSEGGNSTGSDLLWYDLDTVNHVFTVTWDDVGYYSAHDDLVNAFQLQLVDRGNGDFDIIFRYEDVQWTTGDASGGSGGSGGTPARAGYSAGNGVDYFELPQSGNGSEILGLPDTPGNTGDAGVYVFQVRNGQVVGDTLIEDAQGTQFGDSITGNDAANTIWGYGGADMLDGGNGNDVLRGGARADALHGGEGEDRLAGGGGMDILDGGAGADTFHFFADPTIEGRQVDTIVGFDTTQDKIDLSIRITGIDPAIFGHGDLETLADADHLGAYHAVIVTKGQGHGGGGDVMGEGGAPKVYLIVDTNGVAGFQRGDDLLISLAQPVDLDHFDVGDFT